jgi:hypothetical protein
MCVQKRSILVVVGVLGLVSACNQLDTVLPSAGSYQVNALVNQYSLDECSVIAAGDPVLPYFSSPVRGDPDLDALVLYLENSGGTALGNRVRYGMDAPGPAEADGGRIDGTRADGAQADGNFSAGGTDDSGPGAGGLSVDMESGGETFIRVAGFTGKLPPFPMPPGLEIGAYTLVFEIRGRETLLSRMSRPVYYIGDREFVTGEIHYYLPGIYGNGNVVPQGVPVLLETRLRAGGDLEPYVVWYNGNRRIGEGPVTEGKARLFWKAPQKSGFHSIRAELFPFTPLPSQKGRVRELSLPVSAGAGGAVFGEGALRGASADQVLYWYQFAGDLADTRTGMELGIPASGRAGPVWYPAEQVYGLGLGTGESYEPPQVSLKLSPEGEGDLRFFIRLLPLGGGTVFTARLGAALRPVTVTLSVAEEALVLSLEGQDQKSLISRPLGPGGTGSSFVEAEAVIAIRGTTLYGRLELGGFSSAPAPRRGGPERDGQSPGGPEPLDEEYGEDGEVPALGSFPRSSLRESGGAPSFPPEEWAVLRLGESLNGDLRSWLGTGESVVFSPVREEPEMVRQAGDLAEEPAADPSRDGPDPEAAGSLAAVIDDFGALVRQAAAREEPGAGPGIAGGPEEAGAGGRPGARDRSGSGAPSAGARAGSRFGSAGSIDSSGNRAGSPR